MLQHHVGSKSWPLKRRHIAGTAKTWRNPMARRPCASPRRRQEESNLPVFAWTKCSNGWGKTRGLWSLSWSIHGFLAKFHLQNMVLTRFCSVTPFKRLFHECHITPRVSKSVILRFFSNSVLPRVEYPRVQECLKQRLSSFQQCPWLGHELSMVYVYVWGLSWTSDTDTTLRYFKIIYIMSSPATNVVVFVTALFSSSLWLGAQAKNVSFLFRFKTDLFVVDQLGYHQDQKHCMSWDCAQEKKTILPSR